MAWIKSNFRWKARDVDYDAIGQNFKNWIGGSQTLSLPDGLGHGGGFVMASMANSLSGVGFIQMSANEFLFSTYGATFVSNVLLGFGGSGFKVVPINFLDFSGDGASDTVWYTLSATQALAGDDSIAIVRVMKASQTVGSGIVPTSASSISVHFIAFGWIVSAPTPLK